MPLSFAALRIRYAVLAALTLPIGYLLRFTPSLPEPIRDASGGAAYVALVAFLMGVVWPQTAPSRLAFAAFVFTCLVEFAQWLHPPWLDAIRATRPGRLILGTTFAWSDFPPYALGAAIAWLIARRVYPGGMLRNLGMMIVAACLVLNGCSALYYSSMKKLGREKRDILVSRIQDGKKAQAQAAEQFKTALEAFQEVTKFDGGDLEKAHKKLNKQLEDAEDRAKKVHDRVESIDKVANDLFKEWSGEIDKMSTGKLQDESRRLLRDATLRHQNLIRQMRSSEDKMTPVVQAFRDQVLFLKHNLNARAIQSLKKSVVEIDDDVKALILDLEKSNQEADKTIAGLSAVTDES